MSSRVSSLSLFGARHPMRPCAPTANALASVVSIALALASLLTSSASAQLYTTSTSGTNWVGGARWSSGTGGPFTSTWTDYAAARLRIGRSTAHPDAIQFGSSDTRASLDTLAGKMLTAFLNSPAASVQGRVLGVEEEIRGMLMESVPDLYGRVDLLTEDSDSLVITDIKTSRGKWSQEQVEDSGEQLLLYSHLASEIAPGKKIATRFLVLTKTKEPVVEEHVRDVEPAAVKRTLAGVERAWRAIESGVFYPAPSTVTCASCGYRAACRAWAG